MKITDITPVVGYALVEPVIEETKTVSGLHLESSKLPRKQEGKVVAVSVGKDGSPVKVGTKVIYKEFGGNYFQLGDIGYKFLPFEDILATVKES